METLTDTQGLTLQLDPGKHMPDPSPPCTKCRLPPVAKSSQQLLSRVRVGGRETALNPSLGGKKVSRDGTVCELRLQDPNSCSTVSLDLTYKIQIQKFVKTASTQHETPARDCF